MVSCIFKDNETKPETGGEPDAGKDEGAGEPDQAQSDQSETSTEEKQVRLIVMLCFKK